MKSVSFKNIIVSDSIEDVSSNAKIPVGAMLLIQCTNGEMLLDVNQTKSIMMKDDLMFCSPSFILSNCKQSTDFKCNIFALRPHSIDDIVYACFRLDKTWYDKLKYVSEQPIIHLNERQVQIIEKYRELVRFYKQENGIYQKKIADVLSQAIIFELLSWVDEDMKIKQAISRENTDDDSAKSCRANQIFFAFHELIDEFHASQRNVSWYADKLAITPRYLTFVCKKVVGMTAQDFINRFSIGEMKKLLKESDMSVKEIATTMGFSSDSSLCKFFKQQTGQTPVNFRKQSQ